VLAMMACPDCGGVAAGPSGSWPPDSMMWTRVRGSFQLLLKGQTSRSRVGRIGPAWARPASLLSGLML